MFELAHKLLGRNRDLPACSFRFDRPLLLLQSDDWGRVGVRDREGYDLLRESGVRLGEHPYDFYTLETAGDVNALGKMLKHHRDSIGRPPCLEMNFVLANLDFDRVADAQFQQIFLMPLTEGLPGKWRRPGLFQAYREGIDEGVFYPALHGLTHFCRRAVDSALTMADRATCLQTMWKVGTPYIYWRMPWIGYEYCNPEKPNAGFLPAEMQDLLIRQAVDIFGKFFAIKPRSACAPGYRANQDTHRAWSKYGVRVVQNGSGRPLPPHIDEYGLLNIHRTIDFEPTQRDLPVEKYVQLADDCFARGLPAILSIHSINFHSSLKDFRGPTLEALDQFLSALEAKYPNLLHIHDADLYEIVTQGKFQTARGTVTVGVTRKDAARSMAGGAK